MKQKHHENNTMKTLGALTQAIKARNTLEILMSLDIDLELHGRDDDGNTVLHHVLKNPQLLEKIITEILQIFLADGVDPNSENNRGETALHLAVANRMKDAIDILIKYKASINANGRSLISHYFIDDEYKKFWKMGDNSKRKKMETESASFVDWLISRGFDFHHSCERGHSELHLAEKKHLLHIIPTILKHIKNTKCVKLEGKNFFNGTLFEDGWTELDESPEKSWYVDYRLRHATSIVKILLDGSDQTDGERGAVLNLALWSEEPSIFEMVLSHFPDGCDKRSWATAVFCRILSRRIKCSMSILIDLIASGVDVNYKDQSGRCPLYWAVSMKNLEVVKLLKAKAADFNAVSEDEQNLFHTLAEIYFKQVGRDEVEEMLFDVLTSEGCRIYARNVCGFTPLHLAARSGNLPIVRKLIDHGASVDCKNDDSQTPLHLAAANPRLLDVAEFLIDSGADVDARDSKGNTPLHLAASASTLQHKVAMLRLLLSRGAYVDARDNDGNSALAKAVLNNNARNAIELLEHGASSESPCVVKNCQLLFNFIGCKGAVDVILRHRHKLQAANLPHVDVFHDVKGDAATFRAECSREVEVLKRTFIDSRISLYQLLHVDPNSRCIHINNEKLKDIVDSPKIEEQFPKYSTLILASYREALARKSLFEPAKEAWLMLTRISLPDICVEQIFSFLSNDDLVTMIGEDC